MRIAHSTPARPQVSETLALKSLFQSFDKDRDHHLNATEFTAFAKTLGLDGDELFKKLDKRHSGKISFNEFERSLSEVSGELFSKLDKNKDKVIDQNELKAFADEYHFDLKKLMSLFDRKKSGKIKLDDFVKNFRQVLAHPAQFSTLHPQESLDSVTDPRARAALLKHQLETQVLRPQLGNQIDLFW
jgi:Ca2+-binding EF-hand superfamily protein